ncbi:YaaC family protein [Aeromonas veronii]
MRHQIFNENISITPAESQPIFKAEPNYHLLLNRRTEATEEWKGLSAEEKARHNNKIEKFFLFKGIIDLKDPSLIPAKNLYLMNQEVVGRLNTPNILNPLPIDSFYYEKAILELLENMENTTQVKELYRIRKRTVKRDDKSGLNTEESLRIRNCLRQGRDLYLAGKNGSLMVKPLNFFYSLTAYAYAIIVLNNPLRFSLENLPGSHGLNYLPNDVKLQFGGDMPKGTLTDLITSYPTLLAKHNHFEIIQDNQESILELYKNKFTISAGLLLSMIPEIRDYYRLITGNPSRTHPIEIIQSNDRLVQKWEFHIGDGYIKPSSDEVKQSFQNFTISERQGKYVAEVPVSEIPKIRACLFSDVRGRLWFIENPLFPLVLPEIAVHFLLSNTFSNIMRYSPDNWGNILLNDVDSDVSLITRKYLSAFENKFPILALRSISKYYPFIEQ